MTLVNSTRHIQGAEESRRRTLVGLVNAVSAYLIWGLSPIYFKALKTVPAFEILMHRMVWSSLFLLPFLFFNGRWNEFIGVFRHGKRLGALLITTLLVGFNWFLFIWAINHDHVLQTSLGYYINPLVNVLLGVIILGERLRPAQLVAVALAAVAVLNLVVSFGEIPWVSLGLALSFSCYGLIRKVVPVSSIVGLSVEIFIDDAGHRISVECPPGGIGCVSPGRDLYRPSADQRRSGYGGAAHFVYQGRQAAPFFNHRIFPVHRPHVHIPSGSFSLEGTIGIGTAMDLCHDLGRPGHLFFRFGPVLPVAGRDTPGCAVTFSPRRSRSSRRNR